MSEWKKYEGTDEQIAEMLNAEHGFIIRSRGIESKIMHKIDRRGLLVHCDEYLICEEHPLADMIERWARTGQPVYWRDKRDPKYYGKCLDENMPTHWDGDDIRMHPFIDTENLEYRFTPFEE